MMQTVIETIDPLTAGLLLIIIAELRHTNVVLANAIEEVETDDSALRRLKISDGGSTDG